MAAERLERLKSDLLAGAIDDADFADQLEQMPAEDRRQLLRDWAKQLKVKKQSETPVERFRSFSSALPSRLSTRAEALSAVSSMPGSSSLSDSVNSDSPPTPEPTMTSLLHMSSAPGTVFVHSPREALLSSAPLENSPSTVPQSHRRSVGMRSSSISIFSSAPFRHISATPTGEPSPRTRPSEAPAALGESQVQGSAPPLRQLVRTPSLTSFSALNTSGVDTAPLSPRHSTHAPATATSPTPSMSPIEPPHLQLSQPPPNSDPVVLHHLNQPLSPQPLPANAVAGSAPSVTSSQPHAPSSPVLGPQTASAAPVHHYGAHLQPSDAVPQPAVSSVRQEALDREQGRRDREQERIREEQREEASLEARQSQNEQAELARLERNRTERAAGNQRDPRPQSTDTVQLNRVEREIVRTILREDLSNGDSSPSRSRRAQSVSLPPISSEKPPGLPLSAPKTDSASGAGPTKPQVVSESENPAPNVVVTSASPFVVQETVDLAPDAVEGSDSSPVRSPLHNLKRKSIPRPPTSPPLSALPKPPAPVTALPSRPRPRTESFRNPLGVVGHSLLLQNIQLQEKEAESRQKFKALVEISHTMASELKLDSLLSILRQKSKELLEADRCSLFLVNKSKQELYTKLAEGYDLTFPLSEGIAGHVATTGETLSFADAYSDPRFNRNIDDATGYRTKSILCMPVRRGTSGEILGVIQMINKYDGAFSSEDVELLQAFCSHAAVAIENAHLYSRERASRKKFQALVQISEILSSELELEPLVDILRQKSKELLDADRCTLFFFNKDTGMLATKLAEGRIVYFPATQGIAGHAVTTGETLNIVDAYTDPRFNQAVDRETGYKTKSILCMPVRTSREGEIVGAIQMVNKLDGVFGKEDEELLEAFSAQAAVAIKNSQLYEETVQTRNNVQRVLESVPSYVVGFGPDGMLASTNRDVTPLLPHGVSPDIVHTRPYTDWMPDIIAEDITICSEQGLSRRRADVRVGETLACTYSVVPLKGFTGLPEGVLVVLDDVSQVHEMHEAMTEMESRIETLRTEVTTVFEAPIQVVVKTIEEISRGSYSVTEAREKLMKCLKLLSSSDLFQPDFSQLLRDLDKETEQWILAQYTSPHVSVTVSHSWPDVGSLQRPVERLTMLRDWNFDCIMHSEEALLNFSVDIFHQLGLTQQFSIPEANLRSFLLDIRNNYRKNPFHNFQHAFSVFHISYLFLVTTSAAKWLTNLDMFALLIAALCHDLDHPAVNNGYEISSDSALAIQYNDTSVLENYHASKAFQILRRPESNILCGLTRQEYKEVRQAVINAILHTDMALHFEMITKIKQHQNSAGATLRRETKEDRHMLVSLLLHSADLSNPVRPPAISRVWVYRLKDEFAQQVQKEKESGLPVTSFMDVGNDELLIAKNEIGFIDFVCRPLWTSLVNFLPELEHRIATMNENKAYWQSIVEASSGAATPRAAQ
eukprot:TRINITY_DN1326_c0_g1_i5.p1 TRINITY_DN1326_c0_g1~~TRINITY_DN1326_c0_g1_i5.p1  ORF type:complete len:1469 (-),score=315.52 TRINITY_DN1326_c0_g1_i5:74-4432(-)